jgi:hypothetical protein
MVWLVATVVPEAGTADLVMLTIGATALVAVGKTVFTTKVRAGQIIRKKARARPITSR